jgi:hypothetical protein
MKNLIVLAVWVIGLAVPLAARAVPVTWSFHETSCVTELGANCTPPQPFVFVTLTLPGTTSAGSAFWLGDDPPLPPPVYTGDSFALAVPFLKRPLTPAFAGPSCETDFQICDFDISWSETAGRLDAISISIDGFNDAIGYLLDPHLFPLGLVGGQIATMGLLGGCNLLTSPCTIGGFWRSDLAAVPEPMSAVLLITGLLATCLASRSKLSG